MTEEWRPVVGWEGLYEVSNLGRVRSLGRTLPNGRTYPARIMKLTTSKRGYVKVALTRDGVGRHFSVHRLVCTAFHGPPAIPGSVVRHLDGDPGRNTPDNLAWGTQVENAQDRIRHGRNEKANATRCPRGHAYDEVNTYLRPDGKGRDCRECRRATAARSKSDRGPLPSGSPVHGTVYGYTGYSCRCDPCRAVWTEYARNKREADRKKAE